MRYASNEVTGLEIACPQIHAFQIAIYRKKSDI
jgi:hypothetical protein